MRQIFITVLLLFALINPIGAQRLKEMVIEPVKSETHVVYAQSCDNPSLGILVFKTAIKGIQIEVYPKENNKNYNEATNEYVICVIPANKYRITFTCEEYDANTIIVYDVKPNQPQVFTINPKETGGAEPAPARRESEESRIPETVMFWGKRLPVIARSANKNNINRCFMN